MGGRSSTQRWKYKTRLHGHGRACPVPSRDSDSDGEGCGTADSPLSADRASTVGPPADARDLQLPGQLLDSESLPLSPACRRSAGGAPCPAKLRGGAFGCDDDLLAEAPTAAPTRSGTPASPASHPGLLLEKLPREDDSPPSSHLPSCAFLEIVSPAHSSVGGRGEPQTADTVEDLVSARDKHSAERWPEAAPPPGALATGVAARPPGGAPAAAAAALSPGGLRPPELQRAPSKSSSSCFGKRPHTYSESTKAPSSRGDGWMDVPDDEEDEEAEGLELEADEAAPGLEDEKGEEEDEGGRPWLERHDSCRLRRSSRCSRRSSRCSLPGERCRSSVMCSTVAPSFQWQRPEHVLFFVDWDDTLLPTTWLAARPWFPEWSRGESEEAPEMPPEDRALLADLDHTARAFLLAAGCLGHVCCVTLAARPWQARTMRAFLPRLAQAWAELGVEVSYAQEMKCRSAGESAAWVPIADDPLEHAVAREELGVRKKKRAMRRLLRRRLGRSSWRNVLSFGDGTTEQNAMQELAFELAGACNACGGDSEQGGLLVKTVKMLEDPDCAQLCEELQTLTACLPSAVSLVDDFNVTVEEGEEGLLDTYHKLAYLAEAADAGNPTLLT